MTSCPKCQQALEIKQVPVVGSARVRCRQCGALCGVEATVRVSLVMETQGPLNWTTVLAAVEGEATQEMIREVLTEGGFQVLTSSRGTEALELVENHRPGLVIIDVGLPEILGFEFVDILKRREEFKGVGIILLASIYDKRRYKREPESLYGADDYIERHHIVDSLMAKAQAIVEAKRPAGAAPKAARIEVERTHAVEPENLDRTIVDMAPPPPQAPPRTFEPPLATPAPKPVQMAPLPGDPDQHEAAKRLARIIISDIVLYNQKTVEKGLAENNLQDLLKDALQEGQRHYESRVSEEIRSATNYMSEALDNFMAKRQGSKRPS